MRRSVINCLLIFTVVFTIAGCSDPIFYTISREVMPIDPLINGTPTNFVVYGGVMYVASGSTIHSYHGNKNWVSINSPGGRIIQLAATTSNLYALCLDDSNSSTRSFIKKFDGSDWKNIGGATDNYYMIQHIYAAGGMLFIGAQVNYNSNDRTVLYVDNSEPNDNAIKNMINITGEISGACLIGSSCFISTKDNGIFTTSSPASGATKLADTNFAGMINLNNTTIALITQGGDIYTTTGSVPSPAGVSFGSNYRATGALVVWENKADPSQKLLLAGRQDNIEYTVNSGYTYGYLELELNSSGDITGTQFYEPGIRNITTIKNEDDNERYKSTIGKHPVNHIFQAQDGILFASTQKNGVWSYRERKGEYQWNAEE